MPTRIHGHSCFLEASYRRHLGRPGCGPAWETTSSGLDHADPGGQARLFRSWRLDADLAWLDKLPQLKWLDLSDTQITDAGLIHLQGLSQLESLDLSDTQVTDAGLIHLQGLSQLVPQSQPYASDG